MAQADSITPIGVNQIVLNVRDIEEAHRFWTEIIGLKQVGELHPRTDMGPGPVAKMRFYSGDHGGKMTDHDVAIVENPNLPPPPANWELFWGSQGQSTISRSPCPTAKKLAESGWRSCRAVASNSTCGSITASRTAYTSTILTAMASSCCTSFRLRCGSATSMPGLNYLAFCCRLRVRKRLSTTWRTRLASGTWEPSSCSSPVSAVQDTDIVGIDEGPAPSSRRGRIRPCTVSERCSRLAGVEGDRMILPCSGEAGRLVCQVICQLMGTVSGGLRF